MENRVFYKADTKSKCQMYYLIWVVLKKVYYNNFGGARHIHFKPFAKDSDESVHGVIL